MIEVLEWNGGRAAVLRTFDDFAAACAYVVGLGCWAFEPDADHPGCADAFTRSGLVIAIQPKGFKL